MKKLAIMMSMVLVAGMANALSFYTTDFTTADGMSNDLLSAQAQWEAQSGYVVTDAEGDGILISTNDWGRAKLWPSLVMTSELLETNKVVITTDFWYGNHDASHGGTAAKIGISDTAENTGGDIVQVGSELKTFNNGVNWAGWYDLNNFQGTNSWIRWTAEIVKSTVVGEFSVKSSFSNLTESVIIKDNVLITVVNSNAYNAAKVNVGIRTGNVGGVKETKWDNFKVEIFEKPLESVIWEDDFNDLADGASVQYRGNWELLGNNEKWMGYNGYAMQRPGFSTNKTGASWGGVYNETPIQPLAGETVVVEFDWRVFTDGDKNNSYLDFGMQTNLWDGIWANRLSSYAQSDHTPMSFRMEQRFGGGFRPVFYETTNAVYLSTWDDALFGIGPAGGDNTSDTMRVTYTLEKTTTENIWYIDLSVSNKSTGATASIDEIKVDNATWYNLQNHYFYGSSFNDLADGTEGNEYDNFVVSMRSQDPADALPAGVIIDEDFNDLVDGAFLDSDREWDPLNSTGDHFVTTNGVATCWPSEGLGYNWRGEMNTFSTITDVEVGDTIEIDFDTQLYLRKGLINKTMLDVLLSTNYVNAGMAYNSDHAMGIRFDEKAAGDLRIETYKDSIAADDVLTSLTNLGTVAVSGATTTEWCHVTYTLEKSATADEWITDVTISNTVSGFSTGVSDVSFTQAATYNADELFFAFYGASNYDSTNGVSVDNLLVKHIVPALDGYDLWAENNGVTDPAGHNDADGINNWGEWVLNGDPNLTSDVGVVPVIAGTDYMFSVRNDPAVGYALMTTEDLVTGTWITGGVTVVALDDFEMSEISETVTDSGSGKIFVKLYLEQQD
ncbi:hypothetical protein [Pontiella sulfatireligans]|uniref:Uncharacterized protein n=1 Tax=Pontiella sulfatireligans TaxID=2750658 RepID=A0A6C2UQR3_9BACT|nr:hypothetical protein [Pontiella sulfatireligans]VGO22283.1 hypothetical protein SCARR_04365 [Pontiella sulfatireligans]